MAFDYVRRCFYLQISFISRSDSDLLLRARSEPISEMETGFPWLYAGWWMDFLGHFGTEKLTENYTLGCEPVSIDHGEKII